jgi:catechol 2,3-dioxygenase
VLGLRVLSHVPSTATLGSVDDHALLRLEAPGGVGPARRGAFGLFHFAILLPDRAALGRLLGHLSRVGERVSASDHLVSEALYLWDPDGLGIEVYADRPRATWQTVGSQLMMATEPLDLASVRAAGSGEAWIGMPAGTAIGHVHLHVGDLVAAEAFYHRALGFDKTVWDYPGALFLSAGGYHHHLGTNTWSRGPSAAPDEARLVDWELIVPGSDAAAAAAASLRAAGHQVEQGDAGWSAADPWGTRVRVRHDAPSHTGGRRARSHTITAASASAG